MIVLLLASLLANVGLVIAVRGLSSDNDCQKRDFKTSLENAWRVTEDKDSKLARIALILHEDDDPKFTTNPRSCRK